MARVTVEDCLDKVENRFELVMLGSKRARQIAVQGKEPFVDVDHDKATVIALREIAEGHITAELLEQAEEEAAYEDAMDIANALASEVEEANAAASADIVSEAQDTNELLAAALAEQLEQVQQQADDGEE